jgi:hypothetical protein
VFPTKRVLKETLMQKGKHYTIAVPIKWVLKEVRL